MPNSTVIFPVPQKWQGRDIYYVELDSSPVMVDLCGRVQATRHLLFNETLRRTADLVLEILPRNALALSRDESLPPEWHAFFQSFLSNPSGEQSKLSYALKTRVASGRHYHALFFALLIEAGLTNGLKACGKIIKPGPTYTWVEVVRPGGQRLVLDLFAESLEKNGRADLKCQDQDGQYRNPTHIWQLAST